MNNTDNILISNSLFKLMNFKSPDLKFVEMCKLLDLMQGFENNFLKYEKKTTKTKHLKINLKKNGFSFYFYLPFSLFFFDFLNCLPYTVHAQVF